MTAIWDRVQEGLGMIVTLQLPAMFFVDRAQLKSRLVGLLGYGKKVRAIWSGPAVDRTFWMICFPWTILGAVADFVWPSVTRPRHAPWPWWVKAGFGLFVVLVLLFGVLAAKRLGRWRRWAGSFQVSRGALFDSVRKMCRKAGIFVFFEPRVYVLPDLSQAQRFTLFGTAVLVPRQLLDSMSRREMDALVARQLCRQSKHYYYPAFWTLLACDAAAAGLAEWLKPGLAAGWVALLLLLAAQFAVLARYLPRALARADFRAVELTGDPEAFLSSMAGLARFSGTPADEAAIREIARRSGVSAERIPVLLAERAVPAEERYPTTGSYMVTGLQ
jgi:hypothetical protein